MIRKHPYYAAILLLTLFGLNGCTTPEQNARSLMDRAEFEGDEYGSFVIEGMIDLNPIPLVSANVHVRLEKFKDKPIEEVAE